MNSLILCFGVFFLLTSGTVVFAADPIAQEKARDVETRLWIDFFGGGLPHTQQQAWLQDGLRRGDVTARTLVGSTQVKNEKEPAVILSGLAYLKHAATQGRQVARFNLAVLYWNGKSLYWEGEVIERDRPAATALLQGLAEEGYAPAQAWMGENIIRKSHADDAEVQSVMWLEKAAAQGDPGAQSLLGAEYSGRIYRKTIQPDPGKSHYFYALSAGGMYLRSFGPDMDAVAHEKVMNEAREGRPQAQSALAALLSKRALVLHDSHHYAFFPRRLPISRKQSLRTTAKASLEPDSRSPFAAPALMKKSWHGR